MTQPKLRLPVASLLILAVLSSLVIANLTGCKSQASGAWESTFTVTVKNVATRKPIAGAVVNYVSIANTAGSDSLGISGVTDAEGTATLMDNNVDVDTLKLIFVNCTKIKYKVFSGTYDCAVTQEHPSASVIIYLERS